MACGTLLLPRGIKPAPHELETWSLNHWRAKKVPTSNFLNNDGKLFKIFKSNVTDLPLLDPVETRFFRIKEFFLVFGFLTLKLYTSTPLSIRRGQYGLFLVFHQRRKESTEHVKWLLWSWQNWTTARIKIFSVFPFLNQPGGLTLLSDTDFCSILYSAKSP